MNVESRLGELIGPAAGRLHTARSRNDQVATDFRLYVRDTIDETDAALAAFQHALVERALEHAATVMPGFTHLQTAQPVTFGHHLLAYVEMAARDRGRFADARRRLNESPLGAAALAGTSFPIDRDATAKALGFDRPMANSLDAVSDRDFVLETLSAAAIASMHLSRFAEEIVIWTSPLVGLVRLSDKFTTGSSIMPQKRNPDAAELVRAKTGRVIGALTALLIVMKGLPLAYQKDMQEDKQGAMEAFAALSLAIRAMTGMVADLVPDEARMKAAAGEGYATATDLADWLVRTLKMPFRDAHHVTGRIVAMALEGGRAVAPTAVARRCRRSSRGSPPRRLGVLSVEASVKSRTSYGGTAPEECAGAGERLAEAAGKRAKIGLRPGISLQFHGCPGLARAGNLCMVPPHWGFCRESQLQPDIFGMGHHPSERGRARARGLRTQGRARPAAERRGAAVGRAATDADAEPARASRAYSIRTTEPTRRRPRPKAPRNPSFSIRCWTEKSD